MSQTPQDPYQQPQQPYGQPSAPDPYGQPAAPDPYAQPQQPAGQPPAANPYEQNPYAAQPYGQQGYGAGALQEHPQGTMILILGILGFMTGICGVIAWVMGSKAQKEIAASGAHYTNEQNIKIGKILGMVTTIMMIAGIVIFVIAMIITIIAAMASASSY